MVYFGETHIAKPLYDPNGEIGRLKQVAQYPEALRETIIQECLWGAEFSLWWCRTPANGGDVLNTAGGMTRVSQFLIHALFALNREYFVSDKYSNRIVDGFSIRPRDFTRRLAGILAHIGENQERLRESLDLLATLWQETVSLTSGDYRARFHL